MTLGRRLHELQQIDLEIQEKQSTLDEVNHRLGESEDIARARAELSAEEEHLAEIDKQQRDMEREIEDLRGSIAQENDKLYGGKITSPKELSGLGQEVEIFKSRLRQKEDSLLDLMATVETARDKLKSDTEQLRELEKKWQQEQEVLTQRKTDLESQLSDIGQKRQAAAGEVDTQTLDLYEGIRSRKGLAVVRVEQGRCHGCRLTLAVNEWQRAKAGTLVQCSSCGRILYLG